MDRLHRLLHILAEIKRRATHHQLRRDIRHVLQNDLLDHHAPPDHIPHLLLHLAGRQRRELDLLAAVVLELALGGVPGEVPGVLRVGPGPGVADGLAATRGARGEEGQDLLDERVLDEVGGPEEAGGRVGRGLDERGRRRLGVLVRGVVEESVEEV